LNIKYQVLSVSYQHKATIVIALTAVLLSACQTAPKPPTNAPSTPAVAASSPTFAPAPPAVAPPRPRLVLALGGGAARGFAHIGVLQVLEENGIAPAGVVGTSAGSLVAALFAAGNSGAQLQRLARDLDESALTDWTFPLRGVIRGEALASFVRQQTAGKLIEQMALPLGIVATDLSSGEGALFRQGDTGTAVRASSAVPSVFQPVKIGSREFVDGGLVSPVPVRYARQLCSSLPVQNNQAPVPACFVLAVDISSPPNAGAPQEMLGMLLQTFAIMSQSINRLELNLADSVLRPDMSSIKSNDFSARMRAIEAGRAAAKAAVGELKRRGL
jgi:NTE family protein